MNKYHDSVLREITDEIELMSVGGSGNGKLEQQGFGPVLWMG